MKFTIERAMPLADLEVKGRTVTAYAAAFDSPASVYDPQFSPARHLESIGRSAFTKALAEGAGSRAKVLYNHGKKVDGEPSSDFSIPIATSIEVKADGRGLLTVSRYLETDDAEKILTAIRGGAITGQSFRGPVYNYADRGGIVELTECGLREYGPCPFPAYEDAKIVSIRSAADLLSATAELGDEMTDEQKAEMLRLILSSSNTSNNPDTPNEEAGSSVAAQGTTDSTSPVEPSSVDPARGDIDLLALANARRRLDS